MLPPMSPQTTSLVALALLLGGCGGADTAAPEVIGPRAVEPEAPSMSGAVLTTAVDSGRESAAPASLAFALDTERIFLLADLAGLVPDTELEVRWGALHAAEPLHVSRETASGEHRLVAAFPAPPGGFEAGGYHVQVLAGGALLGRVDFRVGGKAQEWTGVRGLQTSSAVTAWTHEPIEPGTSFPDGTRRVHATFQVRTSDPRPFVRVTWLKDGRELRSSDLECGREVRCVDAYEKGGRVPSGDYEVEVQVNGEVLAERGFHVGGDPIGPLLLHAALGVAKGKGRQLPARHAEVFTGPVSGLRCGVRLSTLPEEARVKVIWVALTDGGEEQRHESEEIVTGGGTRTAVVDWPVDGSLEPGRYKAVVLLGSRKLEELAFTVK
jgi:hypothetical protein